METSPHTRGKLKKLKTFCSGTRNIPAYAGKAAQSVAADSSSKKHPRIRGESGYRGFSFDPQRETSPHTRGKPMSSSMKLARWGNIPAYAGKANNGGRRGRHTWKHPRIRGESLKTTRRSSICLETSPHTRGKPQHIESIIPFCTVFSIQASF